MAEDNELETIRKLPPKERLDRLKELEDRKKKESQKKEEQEKKEAEEAKKLVEESLKEIKLDEMLKEIDTPKQKDIDVEKLLDQKSSEEDIKKWKPSDDTGQDYAKRIEELLPPNTLNEIQNWYSNNTPAPDKEEFLDTYAQAREAYETLQRSNDAGQQSQMYASQSEKTAETVLESMRMLRAMGYKMNFFSNNP